jgi:glycosyltransferase involved in cell wall biosynthesis
MKVTLVRARGIDQSVHKIAKILSKNGHHVKLLIWDRQNTLVNKSSEYEIYKFNLRAPYDKIGALFYFPIWWAFEFLFLLSDDSEVIHACDLDTLIPVMPIKFFRKIKICYTIYDFYAYTVEARIPNVVRKLVALVEKSGIGLTDVLFLVDECRFQQVKGAKIKKTVYIYNSPPDCLNSASRPVLNKDLIIFYAGVISLSKGLEYMINAVKELNNVKLVIAGSGADENLLKKLIGSETGVIQYIGHIPYKRVIEFETAADILFAFYDISYPNNKFASPNKLFEAMMCKKPIIVNDENNMADIVRRVDCGIVVPYGDVQAIKEAIIKLKDPLLRKSLGENGRRAYDEQFSWAIMEKRLVDSYEKLE